MFAAVSSEVQLRRSDRTKVIVSWRGTHLKEYLDSHLNYFDKKRNEFLSLLIRGNYNDACLVYRRLFKQIHTAEYLPESDQKAVRQIQRIFRKFRPEITGSCGSEVLRINIGIRKILADALRKRKGKAEYAGYEEWLRRSGLSGKQYGVMAQTVTTFQLTTGCSNFCRRCNEWALPGIRKHFSFDAVKKITKDFFESGNREFVYYCASDPLDWRHDGKTMVDVLAFISNRGYKPVYGLLTKVPRGSEKVFRELLETSADMAVSITEKNRKKVSEIEIGAGKKISAQHDVDELDIPAGLDEDFEEVKSSITDNYGTEITPDGAFLVIPAFTSALNPTGQRRIPASGKTGFFIAGKTGRDALPVEYFKPLEAVGVNGRLFRQDRLFDVQIENIMLDSGSNGPCPPGMMNLEEYFSTFEYSASMSRRKLLPAVARRLRREIILRENSSESRTSRYTRFKEMVRDYYECSRMSFVRELKKSAFSFFLKAAAEYLKKNEAEREIVRMLRKKDILKNKDMYRTDFLRFELPVEAFIEKDHIGPFYAFQTLLFILFEDPEDSSIDEFIINNPAEYDHEMDRFV